ncbi:MAG: hypothetical protein KGI78_00820 [Patescibacteria group bacterium]|nr:hypothetical protein [Patescibacteria group bacterium]
MKMDKFKSDPGGFRPIRYEVLPNGKIIAFALAGTDLAVMQFDTSIDFDTESDHLIEQHKNTESNLAFEYVPNHGFDAVDVAQQKWFHF